jgi:EAL domain-containing protein (putative c-di-GMP-specific phosphodiesterase class I)
MTRVIVIDHHEMVLQSVSRLLSADGKIEIVGLATSAAQGIELCATAAPDVVVIDIQLPDTSACDAIRTLLKHHPHVKVVSLSGEDIPSAFFSSMRAGSRAWVLKTAAIQELRDVINRVAAGLPIAHDEEKLLPTLDQLVVHYQPIVELSGSRIVGFEALVRWQHPVDGLIPPNDFLPFAESTGFIKEIDEWVRQQATAQLAEWQAIHPSTPALWMSVNVSPSDLDDPDLFHRIKTSIDKSGIAPADLVVEITEAILLRDSDQTMAFLASLKALGVGLAIDDFGTAYSSISYIQRFPFDRLKLDMSFSAELPHSVRSHRLIEEIAHMTKSMNMMGIAEGIERADQATALRECGWSYGQGYLFSRPLSPSDCEKLLVRPSAGSRGVALSRLREVRRSRAGGDRIHERGILKGVPFVSDLPLYPTSAPGF